MALLELEDIHFAYPGGEPVLSGVSLAIEAGQRLSLVGGNGAGKSTLLRMIVGLIRPTAGRVIAFGQDRREEADFHEVRRRAGFVFQDPDDQLFSPTVAEDIAFGPMNLGKSREEALALVEDILARLDLTHLRDRITHRLSGGEKRLVTLASVLVMEPELLILDEPTNALDEGNEARLREILQGLDQALLLVSHNADFRQDIAPEGLKLSTGKLTPIT